MRMGKKAPYKISTDNDAFADGCVTKCVRVRVRFAQTLSRNSFSLIGGFGAASSATRLKSRTVYRMAARRVGEKVVVGLEI